jgi:hypothetical protein
VDRPAEIDLALDVDELSEPGRTWQLIRVGRPKAKPPSSIMLKPFI